MSQLMTSKSFGYLLAATCVVLVLQLIAVRAETAQVTRHDRAVAESRRQVESAATRKVRDSALVQVQDVIDVVARCNGVSVHTRMRALDAGAKGDTIVVAHLDDPQVRCLARVLTKLTAEVDVESPTLTISRN